MIDLESVRASHEDCQCTDVGTTVVSNAEARAIEKDGCELQFCGFQLAIDCDKCIAFEGEMRPDLLVLRDISGRRRWVLIESKQSFHKKAIDQIRSGLNIMDKKSYYFDLNSDTDIEIIFAQIKQLREADIRRYRKRFEFRGRRILSTVVQCGCGEAI